ncbi:digestive cysteine proteinase 1-like isoform X2 [Procambarus clarkii]|uniref:digestive cysteine proteinase 1-like isoform X2 n=1 Tax=Procambarus clarkii TaxID=6728 RepID=UPI0037429845
MKVSILLLCGLALTAAHPTWDVFKGNYKRKYKNSTEETRRKKVFEDNLQTIKDHGKKNATFEMAMNEFGDMTGALEGRHFRKTGKLVSLSEQQLVDCSGGTYKNLGCRGGLMTYAFNYIKATGADSGASYPYVAVQGTCKFSVKNIAATLTGYVSVTSKSESALKTAAGTIGPISVAIDASHSSFQFYKSGVYYEPACSSTSLNHGVLVVGYGTSPAGDYWIVKNSWGPGWGEAGYIKMARNKNNNCGIATLASYPIV